MTRPTTHGHQTFRLERARGRLRKRGADSPCHRGHEALVRAVGALLDRADPTGGVMYMVVYGPAASVLREPASALAFGGKCRRLPDAEASEM